MLNVRAFIRRNFTPYDGDESFLAPATPRTKNLWAKLSEMFVEERKKVVLDVSQIPSSITAHAPGYIDKDNEVIVGLQTDAPLKRAVMPNGGLRMVVNALVTYGYKPDPVLVETFTKHRKTHNEDVFDAYTPDIRACSSSHGPDRRQATRRVDRQGSPPVSATCSASRCCLSTRWGGSSGRNSASTTR